MKSPWKKIMREERRKEDGGRELGDFDARGVRSIRRRPAAGSSLPLNASALPARIW